MLHIKNDSVNICAGADMWIFFAAMSAIFAGLTSILAKLGIKKTDSNVATVIRTVVVIFVALLMVLIVGSIGNIQSISADSWIFLIASAIGTGLSWICYFKALSIGDVNEVVPIDKSSTVLTVLLASIFLKESVTIYGAFGLAFMIIGTYLMTSQKQSAKFLDNPKKGKYGYLVYAVLSAVFASLTAILGKVGISGVESNLGTFIRSIIVLFMAIIVVLIQGKGKEIFKIDKKELGYICLSGLATGCSWLCYFSALKDGIVGVVVPIDKLSIVVTVAFSYFVLKEKMNLKSLSGLLLIVVGTLSMLIK